MAKKFYIPVKTGNQYLSKEVKKWLIPILEQGQQNPVSHKVVKAYVAVKNGNQYLSKLFFEFGRALDFWFPYKVKANDACIKIGGTTYTKSRNGIGFFCAAIVQNAGSQLWVYPNFMSTDPDGIEYNGVSAQAYRKTITKNGDTWYCVGDSNGSAYSSGLAISPSNALISDEPYIRDSGGYSDQIFEDWFRHIYTSDYAEDYQDYTEYNLNIAPIELLCRKYFAIFLFKNVSKKSNVNYTALIQNLEDVIQHIVDFATNKNCNCMRLRGTPDDSYLIFYIEAAHLDTVPVRMNYEDTANGFSWYGCRALYGATTIYKYRVMITSGSVIYQDQGSSQDTYYATVGVITDIYGSWMNIVMSNTGVDLHN